MTLSDLRQVPVKDVAETLGFSGKTIRRMIQRRELVSTGYGRSLRIILSSVKAWQDRNTVKGPSDLNRIMDGRRRENRGA